MQYGRVVDATLMIDKDTGRPRGFGFVTFDNESAVEATLQGDLTILGKPIEVKKAQPRGNMRDEDEARDRRGGRRGGKDSDRFRDDRINHDGSTINTSGGSQTQNQPGAQGMYAATMSPQMMAQYWQRMQQYFAQMQQHMALAAAAQGAIPGTMGVGTFSPAMMQQMKVQQMQMQAMHQQMAHQRGSQSPHTQSPVPSTMHGINPAMLQQFQQLQAQQMHMAQTAGVSGAFTGQVNGAAHVPSRSVVGGNGAGTPGGSNGGNGRGTPGYNAQEQLMFEQQKYEQQQARRAAQETQMQQYQQGGPTSWEGMYDDVPQPLGVNGSGGGRGMQQSGNGRQMSQGSSGVSNKLSQHGNRSSQGPQPAPPANAPTGPKNAGVPGANYRGGGRGGHRGGFHPYARK